MIVIENQSLFSGSWIVAFWLKTKASRTFFAEERRQILESVSACFCRFVKDALPDIEEFRQADALVSKDWFVTNATLEYQRGQNS